LLERRGFDTPPHSRIEAAAGAFFQNTPFYPVTEMLKQALAWRGDEPAEQQLTQLESALEMAGLKATRHCEPQV